MEVSPSHGLSALCAPSHSKPLLLAARDLPMNTCERGLSASPPQTTLHSRPPNDAKDMMEESDVSTFPAIFRRLFDGSAITPLEFLVFCFCPGAPSWDATLYSHEVVVTDPQQTAVTACPCHFRSMRRDRFLLLKWGCLS